MTSIIRDLRPSDLPEVFRLYGESFGDEALATFRKRWRWEFVDNPRTAERPARMWVAELDDGRLVGHMASFGMLLKVGDRLVVTSSSGDLLVSPAARGQGLGERLCKAYRDNGDIIATDGFGYQPVTGHVYQRLGYQPVPCLPFYMRPLDLRRLYRFLEMADRLPRVLQMPVLRHLARLMAAVANLVLALINSARSPRPAGGLRVETMSEPTVEVDELWTRVSPHLPCAAVRDRAFLRWRFWEDPHAMHRVLGAREADGSLAGYIVFSVAKKHGVPVARLMDLLCAPDRADVVDTLAAAMLADLKGKGISVLMCWGMHPSIRLRLRRYLYVLPAAEQAPTLLYCLDDSLKSMIYDETNWHATRADGDEGFVP